jgi:hypothetical protein
VYSNPAVWENAPETCTGKRGELFMQMKDSGKGQGVRLAFVLFVLLSVSMAASASNITYNVNRSIGNGGTVTGFIQTDGTIGGLTSANITDWSIVLFTPGQGSFSLFGPNSGNNSVAWSTGADLSATATQLLFDFSGSDFGVFALQQGLFSGNHYYCNGTQTAQNNGYCAQGESVVPQSVFQSGWEVSSRTGNIAIGTAGNGATPEPASLVLLGSGVIAALGAIRRKSLF